MPRKRHRSTWGSNEDAGGGRRRLRYWADLHDGRGYVRHSKTIVGSRRDGDEELARIRVEHAEDAPCPTVGQAYQMWWLPDARARIESGKLAKQTLDGYESKWRVYVGPRWSDVACSDVRALDIQSWLDPMTQKPAADSLALLRQTLDFALTYEVVRDNVARRQYRMPAAHRDLKDGAYTLAELDRIAEAARGSVAEASMLLMMFGSCRTGESLGVRLDEVARVESHGIMLTTAEVVRQVNSDASISPDGVLKNRQSVRTVVVPPPWGDRLWEIAKAARDAGDEWLSDDGCGRPVSQNRLRAEWSRAVERAGLPRRSPRSARRSWETYMRWDMGVDRSKVEQMMGHALPGVTGEHYDKPTATMFVDTVAVAFSCKPFVRE
ncbi:tyrosine-type recombinase/integrase [Thermophilibacter sp.]